MYKLKAIPSHFPTLSPPKFLQRLILQSGIIYSKNSKFYGIKITDLTQNTFEALLKIHNFFNGRTHLIHCCPIFCMKTELRISSLTWLIMTKRSVVNTFEYIVIYFASALTFCFLSWCSLYSSTYGPFESIRHLNFSSHPMLSEDNLHSGHGGAHL